MRRVNGAKAARETVLRRRPPTADTLPEAVRARTKEVFGKEMGPEETVAAILADVQARGDEALLHYSKRLDGAEVTRLEVAGKEIDAAYAAVDQAVVAALKLAAERIRSFHENQRRQSWIDFSAGGLGQLVRPLERVGVYVPGGPFGYPSSVLMSAIPARVAGVSEIVLATPPRKDGSVSPSVLVAADIAQVNRIFAVGGAQAIAGLAYGTQTLPKVDIICGPGNIFVTLAKKAVYGVVGIDGLYGPSETIVVADSSANPASCAADLLAQAEHDPLATPIMITPDAGLADRVDAEVERQLAQLERHEIARAAVERNGGIVVVDSVEEAIQLANEYAPEHLCLLLRDGWSYLGQVRNAGGVFLGEESPEALGDFTAGPSHVMPTGGTARFSSPLNVDTFLKITNLVAVNGSQLRALGPAAAAIARVEGFTGHANAIEVRWRE